MATNYYSFKRANKYLRELHDELKKLELPENTLNDLLWKVENVMGEVSDIEDKVDNANRILEKLLVG